MIHAKKQIQKHKTIVGASDESSKSMQFCISELISIAIFLGKTVMVDLKSKISCGTGADLIKPNLSAEFYNVTGVENQRIILSSA